MSQIVFSVLKNNELCLMLSYVSSCIVAFSQIVVRVLLLSATLPQFVLERSLLSKTSSRTVVISPKIFLSLITGVPNDIDRRKYTCLIIYNQLYYRVLSPLFEKRFICFLSKIPTLHLRNNRPVLRMCLNILTRSRVDRDYRK